MLYRQLLSAVIFAKVRCGASASRLTPPVGAKTYLERRRIRFAADKLSAKRMAQDAKRYILRSLDKFWHLQGLLNTKN